MTNFGLITIYVMSGISLLIAANQHKKRREGNYNFWITAISLLLQLLLIWWALNWKFI